MNTTGNFILTSPTEELIQLDQNFFPNPWTLDQWRELDPETNSLYGWKHGETLIGFALFGTIKGDETAHLYKILVHPQYRGTFDTSLFWSTILIGLKSQGFSSVYLEVKSSNSGAIRFYNKVGFTQLRRNKAYYSNGEDALIMQLTL
jgi:ribosomal-protein-alanine N-acetyltransferase